MRVIVLAGNYMQFINWCQETGFSPAPHWFVDKTGRRWQAVFCDEEGQALRGCYYDAYIKCGTWDRNRTETIHWFNSYKQIAKMRKS